jgi:hypothetical protein
LLRLLLFPLEPLCVAGMERIDPHSPLLATRLHQFAGLVQIDIIETAKPHLTPFISDVVDVHPGLPTPTATYFQIETIAVGM